MLCCRHFPEPWDDETPTYKPVRGELNECKGEMDMRQE